MVTHIGKGKDRTFHPRFLSLMSHYALEPVACTPRAGWEKGQVANGAKLKGKRVFCVTTSLNRNPSFPHTMTSIFIYEPNARLLGAALILKIKPDLLIRSLTAERRAYGISVILLMDISNTTFVFAPRVL